MFGGVIVRRRATCLAVSNVQTATDFRKIGSEKCNEAAHCSFQCRSVRKTVLVLTLVFLRGQIAVRFWADMSSDGPRKCNLIGICSFLVRFGPHRPEIGPSAASTCSRAGLIHKNRGKNPGYSRYKCLYFHIRLKNTGKNNGYSLYFSRDFLTTHRHLTQQP